MYTTVDTIKDGQSEIDILRISNDPGNADMYQLTMANAYGQERGIHALYSHASHMVAEATRRNVPFQVTLHNSPDFYVASSYDPDEANPFNFGGHFDTFYKVFRHELRDKPALMQMYSNGHPQGLAAAEMLQHEGHPIAAYQALGPNTLAPIELKPGSIAHGIGRLLLAARRESEAAADYLMHRSIEEDEIERELDEMLHIRPGDLQPNMSSLRRFRRVAPHIKPAAFAIADTLTNNNVQRTADLAEDLGENFSLFTGDRDLACPDKYIKRNLQAVGFPMHRYFTLEGAHHTSLIRNQFYVARYFDELMKSTIEIQRDYATAG